MLNRADRGRATRFRAGTPSTGGFTLIELAIVMTILGIITALGLPSLAALMRDNQLRGQADRFADGLNLARTEAIQRNATVTFVVNGVGWSITAPDPDGGADIVLHERAPTASDSGFTGTATHPQIGFNGSGRADTGNFRMDFARTGVTCAADGGELRCLRIVMTPRGSVRMCDPAVSSPDPRSCP